MDLELPAQEMVEAIAPLVSGRTINVMDKNAIIIASSDPARVGTFHQGAAEVVASGKMVCIHRDELSRYEGAKEGVNLPIMLDGKLSGVVGIYGEPEEVRDVANLLCVYVRQYFEHAALLRRQQRQKELRSQLLKTVVYGRAASPEELSQLCEVVGAKFSMPSRVIVIAPGGTADAVERLRGLERLPGTLSAAGLLDAHEDVYGTADGCFVWLCHMSAAGDFSHYLERVHAAAGADQRFPFATASGEAAENIPQVAASYREALMLARGCPPGCYCMDSNRVKLEYLLRAIMETDGARFPAAMYKALVRQFGSRDMDWVMTTVRVFYECAGSVGRAAQLLHIHKNTLLYRMRKVYAVLGMEDEDAFTRECFLRLLLVYHNRLGEAGK